MVVRNNSKEYIMCEKHFSAIQVIIKIFDSKNKYCGTTKKTRLRGTLFTKIGQ